MATPEISYSALSENAPPQTIKLYGKLGKQKVYVLVDKGSTHNYLDANLAAKLRLPIDIKND